MCFYPCACFQAVILDIISTMSGDNAVCLCVSGDFGFSWTHVVTSFSNRRVAQHLAVLYSSLPFCYPILPVPINCATLVTAPGAAGNCSDTAPGSNCTFPCDTQHGYSGSDIVVQCTTDAEWLHISGSCRESNFRADRESVFSSPTDLFACFLSHPFPSFLS